MAELVEKAGFGASTVNHLSPPAKKEWPKKINIVLTFEEAMKLHLALLHSLLDLNKLNRAHAAGQRLGVNVCLHVDKDRVTVGHRNTKKK